MNMAKNVAKRFVSLLLVLCTLMLCTSYAFAEQSKTENSAHFLNVSIYGLNYSKRAYAYKFISRHAPDTIFDSENIYGLECTENWIMLFNSEPGDSFVSDETPDVFFSVDSCVGPYTMSESTWAAYLLKLASKGCAVYVVYSDEDTVAAKMNRKAAIKLEEYAEMNENVKKDHNIYRVEGDGTVGSITIFHLTSEEECYKKSLSQAVSLLWAK